MAFIDELLSGNNFPQTGFVDFFSSDHVRYQNGKNISGHNLNFHRQIRIERNIEGDEGYTVTMYNLDGIHPMWGNNIQMAPKRMKITSSSANKITLQGYGYDRMGASFADYGITLFIENAQIIKCTLYMYDRDIYIEYYK